MMDISLVSFALLSLIVVMTPGPTVLLALSNGSRYGFGTASYGIAGAALSDAVLMSAAGLGLGALLATSAVLFGLVKWIGVAYLVWLGVQMLCSSGQIAPVSAPQTGGHAQTSRPQPAVFRKSFLVAVTNPKGYLFFTAFLPQFLIPSEPMFVQYATLAGVFIATDVVTMAIYAAAGAKAMQFLSNQGALWIDRTCGGLLVALGIALAFVKRDTV
jgi:threonine/homoserine/homoserine lactone efflux protein